MAKRFVYLPSSERPFVKVKEIEFIWEPGMHISQKKLSSYNLRRSVYRSGVAIKTLECSRASDAREGRESSAFLLKYFGREDTTLESFYQSSKVLKNMSTGVMYTMEHLIDEDSMNAKKKGSSRDPSLIMTGYKEYGGDKVYPLIEAVDFYNYNYIKSMVNNENSELIVLLMGYDSYVDIMLAWYGGRITPCQAHAVATMKGLTLTGKVGEALQSYEEYKKVVNAKQL